MVFQEDPVQPSADRASSAQVSVDWTRIEPAGGRRLIAGRQLLSSQNCKYHRIDCSVTEGLYLTNFNVAQLNIKCEGHSKQAGVIDTV